MARLPSGKFLVQQLANDDVLCFEGHTEREIARFAPEHVVTQLEPAQKAIDQSDLSDEDQSMANFWFGYFYAIYVCANPIPPLIHTVPVFKREPGLSSEALIEYMESGGKRVIHKPEQSPLTFVKFTEENDWEGETWNFYLQFTGNEQNIGHFFALLRTIQAQPGNQSGFPYTLTFDPPLSEEQVDTLIKHGNDGHGYMDAHQKCVGVFEIPQDLINDPTEQGLETWLYKGQITKWFTPSKKVIPTL